MATVATQLNSGTGFSSGDTVTATKLNQLVNTATVTGIVNADVSASAAIELSKLATGALPTAITVASANLVDGTIVNADINNSAAIAHSKLATITAGSVLMGNASAVPTATALSGDVTVNSSGVTAIGSGVIVDADISASASVAHSKLASITSGQVLMGNASNVPTATALSGDITVNSSGVTAIGSGVIVDADVNASAAISLSKLATGALPAAITVASANIVDGTIATSDLATATANALVPAGAVMPFAMNSAPSGWLAANGTAVSRSTYAALFSAIGTTHGAGDGSTTFNLPDLRGIFVRGSDSQTISGTSYSGTFASKQGDDVKPHNHGITDPGHAHTLPDNYLADSGGTRSTPGTGGTLVFKSVTNTNTTGITINNSTGAETRPANIALLYCIKF